jgi:hypothetical protein
MDALLIVISFLLVPVLTVGFLGIVEERRKHAVKSILGKALGQLAKENELFIADVEFFRSKVIGIDRENKKLVYANYRKKALDQSCIDLNSVAYCRVNRIIDKSSHSVKEIFIEVKRKDQIFRLNFYDRSFDNIRAKALLLKKAEQWKDKINLHRRSANFKKRLEYVL